MNNFIFYLFGSIKTSLLNKPANIRNVLLAILLIALVPFPAASQNQVILNQDYSFLTTDIEVNKLRQAEDTLYLLKCYTDKTCRPRPVSKYKIIESLKTEDFVILKMEKLDSIALSSDPFPLTRYVVHVFRINGSKELGYLRLKDGLTRKEMDDHRTDLEALKEMFFFTYFSDTYLQELNTLKTLTTKAEALSILEHFKSDNFKILAETYKKNKVPDMYGSGFA